MDLGPLSVSAPEVLHMAVTNNSAVAIRFGAIHLDKGAITYDRLSRRRSCVSLTEQPDYCHEVFGFVDF